jgi:serine/threonine protein kinase
VTHALTLPSIGDVVDGKFRIERKLGEGGTSTIYEARHNITDKKFAIKWLFPELALNDAAVERFIHEAKVGGRFVHANVVQVYDICKANDSFYILMELLEGESLQARLERVGRFSVRAACDVLVPCAEAVGAAHRAGIVHRDLKPANIFLSVAEGQAGELPKVLDFGISKLCTNAFSPATTTSRTVIGTPLYMAPEQMRGQPSDARTDIYALGVVLYQLVSGEPPFAGDNYAELVFKVTIDGKPLPLADICQAGEQFAAVVARAMAREPIDRFASMAEFVQALLPYTSSQASMSQRIRTGDSGAGWQSDSVSDGASRSEPTAASVPTLPPDSVSPAPHGHARRKQALLVALALSIALVLAWNWNTRARAPEPRVTTEPSFVRPRAAEPEPSVSAVGSASDMLVGHAPPELHAHSESKPKAAPSARQPDAHSPKPARHLARAHEPTAHPDPLPKPRAPADSAASAGVDRARRVDRKDFEDVAPALSPPEATVSRRDF